MKLRNILYYLTIIILIGTQLRAQNTNPVVGPVTFSISEQTVTVHYTVSDVEQDNVFISMEVSNNSGTTWDFNYGVASGDIDKLVNAKDGLTKTITWTYTGGPNNNFKIRIFANDETADGSPCPGLEVGVTWPVDSPNQTYTTIQIGTQCWLKENLNVGTMINSINGGTNSDGNQTNNPEIEKYCYYNNKDIPDHPEIDKDYCAIYGGLYQWAEAVQYQDGATNTTSPDPAFSGNVQGICPTGWHIPTVTEFQTLVTTISNDGNALKAIGQGSGSGAGTNTSGFSALLAGYRQSYDGGGGSFFSKTESASILTINDPNVTSVSNLYLYFSDNSINFDVTSKTFGFSVRCVKN
jgi:uncharacterized protein (TIGR02145 family)